jgi:ABC-type Fe3+/spermidine/putrescine transport system ATPase subunit
MSTTVSEELALSVDSLRKTFANEEVLRGIDLEIERGEFCVVVGPSGSGKSTLLKCIAGLLDYDGGAVLIGGRDVSGLPPEERDIGFVFQDFEERLFPHMTVEENAAFGLRQQEETLEEAEIDRRITEMLELLAITETRDSLPSELSGGQQQRVELARQLVRQCDVMLLDDPLADLDYKLQKRMELEMRRIHRELDSTFLYVTHNQDQALKLADKLVVLNAGTIEQAGTPEEVYAEPATAFVARFVGDSNQLVGRVDRIEDGVAVVDTDAGEIRAVPRGDPEPGDRTMVVIRPEELTLGEAAADRDNRLEVSLAGRTYTGEETEFTVTVDGLRQDFQVVVPGNVPAGAVEDRTAVGWDAPQGVCYAQLSASGTVGIDDLMEV